MSDVSQISPENPSAFPHDHGYGSAGMNLRDWFAGQAIDAVLSAMSKESEFAKNPERSLRLSAKGAYIVADALLAIRELERQS